MACAIATQSLHASPLAPAPQRKVNTRRRVPVEAKHRRSGDQGHRHHGGAKLARHVARNVPTSAPQPMMSQASTHTDRVWAEAMEKGTRQEEVDRALWIDKVKGQVFWVLRSLATVID